MTEVLMESPLVFTVGADLLADSENRLDVVFYNPKFIHALTQAKKRSYKLVKFGDIISLIYRYPSFYGFKYTQSGTPILKGEDITEDGISDRRIKYLPQEINKKYPKTVLEKNDIVMSVRGTVGKVALVPRAFEGANISPNLIRIRLKKTSEINFEYIATYLKSILGQIFIEQQFTGGVQRTITVPSIESIPVVIPPLETQERIIKLTRDVHTGRLSSLRNAELLLRSINNLIFDELQLHISPIEEKQAFWAKLEDSSESRVDPLFYSLTHVRLMEALRQAPYEIMGLANLAETIVSGQRPGGGVKYIRQGVPSLGGEHITPDGGFDFTELRFIPEDFHKKQRKSWVNPLDILIVKDGATTGKVTIVPKDFLFKECNINEHLFKIVVRDEYDPYYVFLYLWSDLGQEQVRRLISGAAQKGITREAVEKIKVIVPPLEIQKRITQEASKRADEAKKLRKEAEEAAEKAKQEVWDILVGG